MKCEKCGTPFKNGEKFCSKCGEVLEIKQETKIKENFGDVLISVFKFILQVLIKPVDAIKENKDNMSNPIFALILSVFASLVMVISNFIVNIFDVIVVKQYTFGKGYETSWQFSRIGNLDFLELIFKNFFMFAFVIILVAGVFYLSSLVIKKEINFFKSVSISAASIIPFVLCTFVLTPILSLIWSHFVVLIFLGIIYSLSLLLSLYSEEMKLVGNLKFYYFSSNISILVTILYVALFGLFNVTLFGF